jgi:hypothetical protein
MYLATVDFSYSVACTELCSNHNICPKCFWACFSLVHRSLIVFRTLQSFAIAGMLSLHQFGNIKV